MDNSISVRNKLAKKVQYVKWTEKEENYLLEAILEAVEKGVRVDNRKCIKGIEELTGFKRSYGSVENKLSRLRARNGLRFLERKNAFDIANYPIHPDLTLLEQDFSAGSKGIYALVCNKGHHLQVEAQYWKNPCRECFAHNFVGGIPKEDYRPAVVYLIYIKELEAVKIGEALGEGKEAIIKRFGGKDTGIPYDYEILAYDQSTRTEAIEHELWLLKNTIKHKTFETHPGFGGWTEFRNIEVLHEVLPEYETVLDMAYKI